MESKVYIVQIPSRLQLGVWIPKMDLTPAKEYGELEILLPSGLNFSDTTDCTKQLAERLGKFHPSKDYFLPLGDPVACTIATGIVARNLKDGVALTILKWDRRMNKYYAYPLNFT